MAQVQQAAQRIAQKPLDDQKLADLTQEEKTAAQQLKEAVKDTAEELKETNKASSRDILSSLEQRARDAEKLAEKLRDTKDAWASAALLQALRQNTDSADLGDALAAKEAKRGADSASALADKLQSSPLAVKERISTGLIESSLKADSTDSTRLAGRRILDAGKALQSQRQDLAINELRSLSSDLLRLHRREEAAKEMQQLAQKLRDAASQATGQGEASKLAEIPQSTGNASQAQQQSLTDSLSQQQLSQPGLNNQQAQEMQQSQPGSQQPGQGQQQQVIISNTPIPQSTAPKSNQPRDPTKPLLLAPVPGQDDQQDQPKETMTLLTDKLPEGGKATAMPGSGLQAGAATSKLNGNAATQQQKASQDSTVTATQNKSGASSVRQTAGGVTEQQSQLKTQQTTADFIAAEEAALDDASLPPARREQVRRYLTELRKRFEKQP
jgi:hypothetical protein